MSFLFPKGTKCSEPGCGSTEVSPVTWRTGIDEGTVTASFCSKHGNDLPYAVRAYQGEGAVEAVRDLESKVGKFIKAFKLQFKRWVFFNLFTFPFIAMFYVPYNLFWLQFTTTQLLKWVFTSAILASVFNLFYRPYVGFVTRWLDKHAPNKKKSADLKAGTMPTPVEEDKNE